MIRSIFAFALCSLLLGCSSDSDPSRAAGPTVESEVISREQLPAEFELEYPPFPTRVLQVINEVRESEGLLLVG